MTYLTTFLLSKATLPRRTRAVTSVLVPTPRFASRRSSRNISAFSFPPFFFFLEEALEMIEILLSDPVLSSPVSLAAYGGLP